jgi:hypothetical protein
VEKQIAKLRQEGRLRRIGPSKGGHWEVLWPLTRPNPMMQGNYRITAKPKLFLRQVCINVYDKFATLICGNGF